MAQFTRTHGDYQPVANFDQFEYTIGPANYATIGVTVQPQGPKLEYVTIDKTSGGWTADQFNAVVQTVQQLATVYLYEFQEDATDHLAVAFYPIGAWGDVTSTDPGSLIASIAAAGAGAVTVSQGATFHGCEQA